MTKFIFCVFLNFSAIVFPFGTVALNAGKTLRGINSKEIYTAADDSIGFHKVIYDSEGVLLPWTPWKDVLAREINWYLRCPVDKHGYPIFVFNTFMDGNYKSEKTDIVPCTQDGMGIISYLKYWKFTGKKNKKVLELAEKMGNYLVNESLTHDKGFYPLFTRSTGNNKHFPLKKSAQGDAKYGVNVIEPDKGGIAGYALVQLYDVTKNKKYLMQAVRNADDLMKNMWKGDAQRAPWPFRIDAVTGKYWGERNGDMVFILRLFDVLSAKGYRKYDKPWKNLCSWIKRYQIPAPDDSTKNLWINFFEDFTKPNNRNSWSPLEMAKYLIEKKNKIDPDWYSDTKKLIDFAIKYFSMKEKGGVMLMTEQDGDLRPWGGACSKLGAVAAMFYAAGGPQYFRDMAYHNLNWVEYSIDNDGCPTDLTNKLHPERGGWQEDCSTDVIHNFIDAMDAVPAWRK